MKVLLDPQSLFIGMSGMMRYYQAVYEVLIEQGIDVICPIAFNKIEKQPEDKRDSRPLYGTFVRLYNRLQKKRIINKYYKAVLEGDYDVIFVTAFNFETGFLKYRTKQQPFVMTVHDTMRGFSANNVFFDFNQDDCERLGYLANQAKKVITVSDYTKSDLCSRYMVDPQKAETVYLANFLPAETAPIPDLPGQYILHAGSRYGRKNFFKWMKSVASYLHKNPQLKVVLTSPLSEPEVYFYKKLHCFENIFTLEHTSDAQLNTLYQNALCLSYPSLYEGFGLPVLEAMSHGCPVITSNCTSLPEVAGNAALLIDPTDKNEMIQSLQAIHTNAELRKELKEKGLEQSKKFSREKFAKETIRVLESALKSSEPAAGLKQSKVFSLKSF
jgi:glycosyltransferase involved in cell wall biosynthesis